MAVRGGDYDTTFEPNYYDDDDESQDSKGALEEEINADLDDGDDDFASLRKQSCWSRACSSRRKTTREIICGVIGTLVSIGVLAVIMGLTLNIRSNRPVIVIMISVDGYRWDYLYEPGFSLDIVTRMIRKGVGATLVPVFPSQGTPNHYSIVTGMYTQYHGITGDTFYDPIRNRTFDATDASTITQSFWWKAEPIWNIVHLSGSKSAVMWDGGSALIGGQAPDYTIQHTDSLNELVEQVIGLLDLNANSRPTFLAIKIDSIAQAARNHGPMSTEVQQAIAAVDNALSTLMKALDSEGRQNNLLVNVIVVSPRGFTDISPNRTLIIDNYVNISTTKVVGVPGAVVNIWPPDTESINTTLENLNSAPFAWKVYSKETIPQSWGYAAADSVAPIVAVADPGFIITTSDLLENNSTKSLHSGGLSGYETTFNHMYGIFAGYGPNFLNLREPYGPLSVVEVHNLLCCILHLPCQPNNGTTPCVPDILVS